MTDLGHLLKQAQRMQSEMQKTQAELANVEVHGEAGGGLVRLTISCAQQVRKIHIDQSLLGMERDMLEVMLIAAFNDALRKVERTVQDRYSGMTGGLGLPSGLHLPR